MSHDLNFKDIDHTGALLRSFNFLLKDSDDNKTSIQVTTDFAPFRWDFDENISMNIDNLNFDLFCNDNTCLRIFAWSATLPANLY